jgi:hypothetical protein
MDLEHLRAEIGLAGEAPDIDRALAAAEDDIRRLRSKIQRLRWEIGPYRYRYHRAVSDRPSMPGLPRSYRPAYWSSRGLAVLSGVLLALAVILVLIGNLKITFVDVVFASVLATIPLLFVLRKVILKSRPFVEQLFRYVHQRLWLPLSRNVALRLRAWRYAILRDFVTVTIVVILLVLGATSVLVTTYEDREAFGKPLDYIMLGLGATTVSIAAAVFGYLSSRFHNRASRSKL